MTLSLMDCPFDVVASAVSLLIGSLAFPMTKASARCLRLRASSACPHYRQNSLALLQQRSMGLLHQTLRSPLGQLLPRDNVTFPVSQAATDGVLWRFSSSCSNCLGDWYRSAECQECTFRMLCLQRLKTWQPAFVSPTSFFGVECSCPARLLSVCADRLSPGTHEPETDRAIDHTGLGSSILMGNFGHRPAMKALNHNDGFHFCIPCPSVPS
jgi:hypothetical protein